ncbi:MAG: sulfatase family protein [Nocardioidaceae bacterium]
MDRSPNVLFIMSDQHNARCLGHAGHPDVKTPGLDRLAERGVRFTHAFAQSPICTPSRTSFMSGQYCHNHGYFGLSDPRSPGPAGPVAVPSLFSHAKSAGYRTGVIGKTHTPRDWLEPYVDTLRDCIGFLAPDAYAEYLTQHGLLSLRDDRMLPEHFARHGSQKGQGLDARCSTLPLEHSVEQWCFDAARSFVSASDDRPWLAWVSFPRPHQVWTPSEPFWSAYREDTVTLPPSADDPLTDKPPHQIASRRAKGTEGDWYFEPTSYEAGRRRVLRGYLGLVSQTDQAIGQLLDLLDQRGLTENTIVIYTADHGDFAGEHGLIEKAPGISYDAITRVPYIWSWPGRLPVGQVSEGLVETVDLFPTLSALMGLPSLTSWDGSDLSNVLYGAEAPGRDAVFTECPWAKAIRTSRWKFVSYPNDLFPQEDGDVGELYDLAEDPWEVTNLYHSLDHQDVVDLLRRRLMDWLVTTQRVRTTLPAAHGSWRDGRHFDDGMVSPQAIRELAEGGYRDYL